MKSMEPAALLKAAIAALPFFFILWLFLPTLAGLAGAWQSEEYSHGFMIPAVAALIGWNRLCEKKPPLSSSWWGVVFLPAAALLLAVSRLSAFEPPAQYGLIVALVGLSLALAGKSVTRILAPAFVYLLFAIPLPRLIYVALSQDLQMLSSTLGVAMLDLLDIPVFQNGNIINLGDLRLQVAEACSGLRYLFPLMSFGYLMAFLMQDRLWKRATVFLSTIPIAIALNSLRIAMIGVTVELWGAKMAGGLLHQFEGWSVFMACLILLVGEAAILLRVGRRGTFRYDYIGIAKGAPVSGSFHLSRPGGAAFILTLCLACAAATGRFDRRAEIVPPHPSFAAFDTDLGPWSGRSARIAPDALNELKLTDYWLADYTAADKKYPVNFYMAYYAHQRDGASAHSPSNCLPGGGWQIVDRRVETVSLPQGGSVTLSRLVIREDKATQLLYYWFDERGRDLTEQYGAKWYLFRDSITMHRTDGALVRLSTPIGEDENEDAAARRLDAFLALAYPRIKTFIPGASGPYELAP